MTAADCTYSPGMRSRPAEGRPRAWRRVVIALLASAALHMAFASLIAPAPWPASAHSPPTARLAHGLQVRLLAAEDRLASAGGERRVQGQIGQVSAAEKTASARKAPPGERPLLALNGPYYYPASELDTRAHPLTAIDLPDPADRTMSGYLVLRLLIDEAGEVDRVIDVVDDAQPSFEREARAAFARARYAPGTRDGRPVKSELLIEIRLKPQTNGY